MSRSQAALSRYPFPLGLGGRTIILRPLQRGDEQQLLEFFKRLPVDERAMLKDDVTNPAVIAAWCSNIDAERILPIVALDGNVIVADATLHRSRGGWSRHVAAMRITVDPSQRRRGLGRALIRELMDLAGRLHVAVLDAEVLAEQKSAIALFEDLGFHCIATLPQHAVDLTHQPHDLLLLSKTLTPVERLSPDAWRPADEVDEGGGG